MNKTTFYEQQSIEWALKNRNKTMLMISFSKQQMKISMERFASKFKKLKFLSKMSRVRIYLKNGVVLKFVASEEIMKRREKREAKIKKDYIKCFDESSSFKPSKRIEELYQKFLERSKWAHKRNTANAGISPGYITRLRKDTKD